MKELNKHQQSLIDRLFAGKLPKEEQDALKQAMKDQRFRAAVDLRRNMRKAFEEDDEASHLKRQLQARNREKKTPGLTVTRSKGAVKVFSLKRALMIAASFAVLILAGISLLKKINPSASSTRGYAEIMSLKREPIVDANRGVPNSDLPNSLLINCQYLYFNGKYQEALSCFSEMLVETNPNPEVKYYIGNSQFELQQFEEALQTFDEMMRQKLLPEDNITTTQLKWNHMLAQILAGREGYDTTLQFFADNPKSEYYSDAQRLLSILNGE